ncbi:MAG: universal stress protein [Nocardioides sp.]|nr:universal stress protein [Nocardioides sp.]
MLVAWRRAAGRRSSGARRFRSLLLGSVSQGVVSHAPCSVIVVRAPKARPEHPVPFGTTHEGALAGR